MRRSIGILRGRERGISLLWSAVAVAVLSLAVMTALMSMRQERNLFADMWGRVRGESAEAMSKVAEPAAAAPAIRKCMIGGKTVYSNVECKAGTPGSREVDVASSRGIEPPKAKVEPQGGGSEMGDVMAQERAAR